jgi:hypothetical protein
MDAAANFVQDQQIKLRQAHNADVKQQIEN